VLVFVGNHHYADVNIKSEFGGSHCFDCKTFCMCNYTYSHINEDSVVQLLLTYGSFYKNVPTKVCMKQQIHTIQKEDK